jgi:hypothetical protein
VAVPRLFLDIMRYGSPEKFTTCIIWPNSAAME